MSFKRIYSKNHSERGAVLQGNWPTCKETSAFVSGPQASRQGLAKYSERNKTSTARRNGWRWRGYACRRGVHAKMFRSCNNDSRLGAMHRVHVRSHRSQCARSPCASMTSRIEVSPRPSSRCQSDLGAASMRTAYVGNHGHATNYCNTKLVDGIRKAFERHSNRVGRARQWLFYSMYRILLGIVGLVCMSVIACNALQQKWFVWRTRHELGFKANAALQKELAEWQGAHEQLLLEQGHQLRRRYATSGIDLSVEANRVLVCREWLQVQQRLAFEPWPLDAFNAAITANATSTLLHQNCISSVGSKCPADHILRRVLHAQRVDKTRRATMQKHMHMPNQRIVQSWRPWQWMTNITATIQWRAFVLGLVRLFGPLALSLFLIACGAVVARSLLWKG